jgi:hypothetical protein
LPANGFHRSQLAIAATEGLGPDSVHTHGRPCWNLLHVARMLKDAGGIPADGNQRTAWDAGCHREAENTEHR